MNALLAYLFRVILISGFMLAYYRLFLQNALFHQYNRRFLLAALVCSLILPFIHVPLGSFKAIVPSFPQIGVLHQMTSGSWELSAQGQSGAVNTASSFYWQNWGGLLYLLVAGGLLLVLLFRIQYILRLSAKYPLQQVEDVPVYLTCEPGTPFSFLHMIFWNNKLDMNSQEGNQIFRHELYHVRQHHSLDILLLEFIRRIFWVNPFFHLICKELQANHEFLADRFATSSNDKYGYAELLLWQSIGIPSNKLVHSFFHTHLKRRIAMLTKSKNTRPGYFSRIMVLPLVLFLFCAFAIRQKKQNPSSSLLPPKTITVVIDAGHGGFDAGAISKSGVNEKDIVLAIAKKVKQLSAAYNIRVLMTRDQDIMAGKKATVQEGLHYRTTYANEQKADLFISIHTNTGSNDSLKGVEVYLSKQNSSFQKSASLGTAMIEEMKKTLETNSQLQFREEGIWVLKASAMPAVLLMIGNLDNREDLSFISQDRNQEILARNLLQGILHYEETQAEK